MFYRESVDGELVLREISWPVRPRGVEKEQLLWGKAAPSWGYVICVGKGKIREGLWRKVELSEERREHDI